MYTCICIYVYTFEYIYEYTYIYKCMYASLVCTSESKVQILESQHGTEFTTYTDYKTDS